MAFQPHKTPNSPKTENHPKAHIPKKHAQTPKNHIPKKTFQHQMTQKDFEEMMRANDEEVMKNMQHIQPYEEPKPFVPSSPAISQKHHQPPMLPQMYQTPK